MSFETIAKDERKANKEHKCDWCLRIIKKGEKYKHSTNKFGGEIYSWKECHKCEELVEEMFNSDYYNREGYCTAEDFREFLSEREVKQ